MKKITLLILVLALIAACLLLTACGNGGRDSDLEKFEQLVEDLGANSAEPFAEMVYVIIPQNATAKLAAAANDLALNIKKKTGVEAIVKYDNEDISVGEKELELLLGNTDRLISKEAMKPLKVGEYICRWDRGAIVLGGRHDADTVNAIYEFTRKVLPGSTRGSLMGENVNFEREKQYGVSSVLLNGYDLYDYTLVYDKDTLAYAKTLVNHIAKNSGYLLDLKQSGEEAEGKLIRLSFDADAECAMIEPQSKNISLRGSDEYELSVAIAEFAKRLLSAEGGVAKANIYERVELSATPESIRFCSANVFNSALNIAQIDDIIDKITNKDYDLITFSGDVESLASDIEYNLPDGYVYTTLPSQNGAALAAVYKANTFESITAELLDKLTVVTFKAESNTYRIIISPENSNSAVEQINALIQTDDAYDALLLSQAEKKELLSTVEMTGIGGNSWVFGKDSYSQAVFAEPALCGKATVAAFEETAQKNFVNSYIFFDISVTYCKAFTELDQTLN